jgi:hypothetical protein
MTIRDQRAAKQKRLASRPMNLEPLEARMMCTINDLEQSLSLLAASPFSSNVSSAVRNQAPVLAQPIGSQHWVNGVVTTKTATLSALGSDDKGESQLTYTWSVVNAPSGGKVSFSANANNAAKSTRLEFNKPGSYSVQLRIADRDGAAITRTQVITVVPAVAKLEMQVAAKTIAPNTVLTVTGAAERVVVRAFDQFGAAMTSQPALKWTSTVVPSGGAATISSTSNSLGTATTFSFKASGDYAFEVSSGNVKTGVKIKVAQTLSSISVTPGAAELAISSQRQFVAQGLDQFRAPMKTALNFTWTATGGSIHSTGLYNAGPTAGNYKVTAKSGSIVGTASVKLTAASPVNDMSSGPFSGISNAPLRNLTETYYADGSITRPEMIQLLRSVGADGIVDSVELADLRYLVANGAKFNIPAYVQNLASDVVNRNQANSFYQGESLGDLTIGSTSTHLNKLVDKWFLGTDRPALTSNSLSYLPASGSLFVGLPTYTDQRQGALGDCYFIAALGSLATSNPAAIQNMFIDNGDGTYTVRFYGGSYGAFYNADGTISEGFANGVGIADYVTVDRLLPAFSNGTFAYSNYGLSLSSPSNVLWIALAEKAYAQWSATGNSNRPVQNSYEAIEGGWMSFVDAQVLGYNATRYSFTSSGAQQALNSAIGLGRAVTTGTKSSGLSNGLYGSHAYTITGYNPTNGTYSLYNPWGSSQPTPLTWAQMQANLTQFIVANGSNSTPIFTPVVSTSMVRGQFEVNTMQAVPLSFEILNRVVDEERQVFAEVKGEDATQDMGSIEPSVLGAREIEQVAKGTCIPEPRAVDELFAFDDLDALFKELLG